jgi:hypothetical protein
MTNDANAFYNSPNTSIPIVTPGVDSVSNGNEYQVRRMPSWRRMALVGTDVSKESITSIIRVERISELRIT